MNNYSPLVILLDKNLLKDPNYSDLKRNLNIVFTAKKLIRVLDENPSAISASDAKTLSLKLIPYGIKMILWWNVTYWHFLRVVFKRNMRRWQAQNKIMESLKKCLDNRIILLGKMPWKGLCAISHISIINWYEVPCLLSSSV